MALYNLLGGIDYDPGPHNVTIPAKDMSVVFNISIFDDKLMEDMKTFNLMFMEARDRLEVYYRNYEATVIIMDDDECE